MGKNMLPTDTYRTSDLYYAAYLKVAGVPFKDTARDGNRVYFLFEGTEDSLAMRDLKSQFFNGKAKVSALEYKQAIQTMKSLTHMGN